MTAGYIPGYHSTKAVHISGFDAATNISIPLLNDPETAGEFIRIFNSLIILNDS